MHNRELIGLDIGKVKTGLARASSAAGLAEPLESIATDKLVGHLKKLENVEAFIVGLPRNLDGNDTAQTHWVREFVEGLKTEVKLPLYWQDEALTSREAAKGQRAKGKGQTVDDHALAAKIILQDWVDAPKADRVRC